LIISERQAERLSVKSRTQWSPYLEKCCLLLSSNESYQRAEEDIKVLTGIKVSHGTQQRIVHRQTFQLPQLEQETREISIDGGKVRLRTPQGKACEWKDYKAVNLHQQSVEAFFQENKNLVDWVNQQPLANPVTCLGDGHCGVWNIFAQIGDDYQRQEILDWYHLIENLGKVGGSHQRLNLVESLLWKGDVDAAIQQFSDWKHNNVDKFINYLNQHRTRIINYGYFQAEGFSIGSGAIESTIKQIGRRVKISGAQWKTENVAQVLRHRCAYLNGSFSS
jgi:hypothetical protein